MCQNLSKSYLSSLDTNSLLFKYNSLPNVAVFYHLNIAHKYISVSVVILCVETL